ncbi:MAG: hypothetical protein COZ59_01270 [Bacteroidetes bacterium CG_4_8_14_3_um_filter_31_14]|nr:MAG: hypothetical protein COZ59_01270 [Bacteroidetes bacterium CG_4_8_14_3_um_filter_31_14]
MFNGIILRGSPREIVKKKSELYKGQLSNGVNCSKKFQVFGLKFLVVSFGTWYLKFETICLN